MKTTIEKILTAHGIFEAFQCNENFSAKIENGPYLPLCIEKHGNQVTVTHYVEQNGDLIPDPDMEFEILNGEWSPVALQLAIGTYYRARSIATENATSIRNKSENRPSLPECGVGISSHKGSESQKKVQS
jgi:hypothetical protein